VEAGIEQARLGLAQKLAVAAVSSNTLEWLIERFEQSPAFLKNKPATLASYRCHLRRMKAVAGSHPFRQMTTDQTTQAHKAIAAETPGQANNVLNLLRAVFNWAIEEKLMSSNPALGVKVGQYQVEPFHPWSEDEIAQYERTFPIGTNERVWLDVILYTGARRSDAVLFNDLMVRNGVLTFTPGSSARQRACS
jgi:site-specific recombinase XerD